MSESATDARKALNGEGDWSSTAKGVGGRNQDAAQEAQQEAYDHLIHAVSHDMGAPLRAICSFAELLEEHVGASDETSVRYTDRIVAAALQLRTMLDGLLTHSRVGRSRANSPTASVEVAWAGAVLALQDDLQGARIEATSPLPSVACDPDELQLIFTEALKNACKFRAPDRRLRIRLSAESKGNDWQLTVTDNGVGLPSERCSLAFNIFSRLHGEQYAGAGMGLSIVQRVATVWNGSARLESLGETGVALHVTLSEHPTE